MRVPAVLLALVGLAGSCNFDAAFDRYCAKNPRCQPDAGNAPAADVPPPDAPPPDASPPDVSPPDVSPPDASPGDAPQEREGRPEDAKRLIPPPRNCGPSAPCPGPGEICHPFGFVCLQPCSTTADCPPWLDNCTEITDASGTIYTNKVCTCTSAQICDNQTNGFACNPLDNICEKECAGPDECGMYQPPRLCDRMSGLCVASAQTCYVNAHCPSPFQPRCDPVSNRCVRCTSNDDCAGRRDGLVRCDSNGSCVNP
jgi:hypothetical protein